MSRSWVVVLGSQTVSSAWIDRLTRDEHGLGWCYLGVQTDVVTLLDGKHVMSVLWVRWKGEDMTTRTKQVANSKWLDFRTTSSVPLLKCQPPNHVVTRDLLEVLA